MKKTIILAVIMLSVLVSRSQSLLKSGTSSIKIKNLSMPCKNKILVGGKSGVLLIITDL
ncbi:MAG TPA: hypothetical protein PLI47_00335 [Bacteroidia bacterium]|jgi:hypothetical protein|nr:hypothetical protein [Bacteroidota bacterium]MBP9790997.1 hypothetical protein [Bacteroidia bacterium]MBK7431429.1 hypothetical protein [Bacteroidota bacterium]MBK7571832.1 hypothetical protein [Bacteroidota bacterium]MBP9923963.1 hypothetical protein [Bacteroidia bacterium]